MTRYESENGDHAIRANQGIRREINEPVLDLSSSCLDQTEILTHIC